MARKRRGAKKMEEMALEIGYSPGEFQLRRLHEGITMVRRWQECLEKGVSPDELTGTKAEVRHKVEKFAREIAAEERDMLAYFHPKKKQAEVKIDGDSKLRIEIARFSADDTTPE